MSSAAEASAMGACSSVDLGRTEHSEQPAVAPSVSSGPSGGQSSESDRKNAAAGSSGSCLPESQAQAPRKKTVRIPTKYSLELFDKASKIGIEAEKAYYHSDRENKSMPFSQYMDFLETEMQFHKKWRVKTYGDTKNVSCKVVPDVKSDLELDALAWTVVKRKFMAKAEKIRQELANAEEIYRIVELVEKSSTFNKMAYQSFEEQKSDA